MASPDNSATATAADQAAATEAQNQAQTGADPAAAERAATEAGANAAQAASPGLSDAEAEKIGKAAAKAQIEELEARGVFDTDETGAQQPAPAPAPAPAPEPGNTSQDTPPGQSDDKPEKKSFAAKFMGL